MAEVDISTHRTVDGGQAVVGISEETAVRVDARIHQTNDLILPQKPVVIEWSLNKIATLAEGCRTCILEPGPRLHIDKDYQAVEGLQTADCRLEGLSRNQ